MSIQINLKEYEARTVKTGIHYRNAEMVVRSIPEGVGKTYEFTCSSEFPVEDRWMYDEENNRFVFGTEILLHGAENVDMEWISSGNAPFLKDHCLEDQVGVITSAALENRVLKVSGLKFSRSQDAQDLKNDIDDGIRKNVSIGYIIEQIVEFVAPQNGQEGVYQITRWKPYEVSSVSIPAVEGVGFGRGKDQNFDTIVYRKKPTNKGEGIMPENTEGSGNNTPVPAAPVIVREVETDFDRIKTVAEMNSRIFPGGIELATKAIIEKRTLAEFVKEWQPALLKESERKATMKLDLTEKEVKRFSLVKLIRSLSNDEGFGRKDATFEYEVCEEYSKKSGLDGTRGGIVVPYEAIPLNKRAAITVASPANAAGVQGETTSGEVIEYLRAASSLSLAGARFIPGLVGKFDMARVGVGTTGYWVGEVDESGADITTSSMDLDLLQFTMKTVGSTQAVSRFTLKQTSIDVEAVIRQDIFATIADKIDSGGLAGTGSSNQPGGIVYTSGVGTETFATAATPLWANLVNMESTVAVANALRGKLAYIMHPTLRGLLKQTLRASGVAAGFCVENDTCNGYSVISSTNALKSSVKQIIFGNFSELMVGMWGGLEIVVNPYSNSLKRLIRVEAFQDVDIQLRHPASFVYNTN